MNKDFWYKVLVAGVILLGIAAICVAAEFAGRIRSDIDACAGAGGSYIGGQCLDTRSIRINTKQ